MQAQRLEFSRSGSDGADILTPPTSSTFSPESLASPPNAPWTPPSPSSLALGSDRTIATMAGHGSVEPMLVDRKRLSISSSSQASPGSSLDSPGDTVQFQFGFAQLPPESPFSDVPTKVEELDDSNSIDMAIIKDEPRSPTPPMPQGNVPVKRGRGRPKKLTGPTSPIGKVPPKGRTKTGCLTCRKRKKKCDENKPACNHCIKNNVICEGYPPVELWKSGKQKSIEARRHSLDIRDLPNLIPGVETDIDRKFLEHFNNDLSKVLSLFNAEENPFQQLLLPMALEHSGLMHSLLCLSGSHLLAQNPNPEYETRRSHHFEQAISILRTDMAKSMSSGPRTYIEDKTSAQVLVLCLETIAAGHVHGEYRSHMDAARHLIKTQEELDPDDKRRKFQRFLIEFFIYYDVSNSVTSASRRSILMDEFQLPQFMIQKEAGSLLGVVDGLFVFISKIRKLRDRIRERRNQGQLPLVDYTILMEASQIDQDIRSWVCPHPAGTSRYIAGMLYRQTTWLYLNRTILASEPSPNLKEAVDEGLRILKALPSDSSTQSILLMPLFLLGCSAFHADQRPDIQKAFVDLQAYSSLGNIKYAKIVVEKVWEMMDQGDAQSWDWETIIENQGWDFLIT